MAPAESVVARSEYNQQRAHRLPSRSNGGGLSCEHMGMTWGHRGWNRQPVGGSIRLGGSPVDTTSLTDSFSGLGAESLNNCV